MGRRRIPVLLSAVCALAGATVAVRAATVEIVIVDENGAPVPHASVLLSDPAGGRFQPLRHLAETDRAGRAELPDVDPGPYRIVLRGDVLREFVAPELDPSAPPARVTVAPDDERVRAEVRLRRGVLVTCRVVFDGRDTRSVTVRFHEVDHDLRLDKHLLKDDPPLDQLLPPGRWEAELDPPPGFLLRDLDVDGLSVAGHVARLELRPAAPPSYVTWTFAAPARLSGRVTFDGDEVGVRIRARLLEPGPWIEDAKLRGGSEYAHVEAGIDRRHEYEMVLPDGRWSVVAAGPEVAGCEPPSVEITAGPGDDIRQDFTVRGDPSRGALLVKVLTPEGRPLSDATVELWPSPLPRDRDQPLAREVDNVFFAAFRDVAAGDYVVAAAREGFLEGTTELRGFDPDERERRVVEVRLREGAAVHVVATDERGRAAPGIELALERLGDPPDPVVRDPELAARLLSPKAETDGTGHAWLEGLWPGAWVLTGRAGAHAGEKRFVRFRRDGRVFERLELATGESGTSEVEAVLVPAASVAGRVACGDGTAVPGLVSVALVDGAADPTEVDPERLVEQARFRYDRVPLTGEGSDRFVAGPLDDGAFLVAIRPEGWQRWTFVPGVEHPAETSPVQALAGPPADVGTVELDCGPALRIAPRVADGGDLPDLRAGGPRATAVSIEGTVERDGERLDVRGARIDRYADHVVLRGLPGGEARLDVELRNDHWLPSGTIRVTVEEVLERGRVVAYAPELDGVGGALDVARAADAWVFVEAEGGAVRSVAPGSDRAPFPSLPCGTYAVRWCSDPDCATMPDRRAGVRVEPDRTSRVAPP